MTTTTTTLRDALNSNSSAADDELAVGVTVGDIRRWRAEEKKLLVGLIEDQIRTSQSRILLDQSEAARAELAATCTANARKIQQLEMALRAAEDVSS